MELNNLIELTFPYFTDQFNLDNQYLFMLDVYEKYFHPDLIKKKTENKFIEDIEKIAKTKRTSYRNESWGSFI